MSTYVYICLHINVFFSATCYFPIFNYYSIYQENCPMQFDAPKTYLNIIPCTKKMFNSYSIYQKHSDTTYPYELPLLDIRSFPPYHTCHLPPPYPPHPPPPLTMISSTRSAFPAATSCLRVGIKGTHFCRESRVRGRGGSFTLKVATTNPYQTLYLNFHNPYSPPLHLASLHTSPSHPKPHISPRPPRPPPPQVAPPSHLTSSA